MIIYAAIALLTLVIITLGMAVCGWYRHLRHDENERLPPNIEPVDTSVKTVAHRNSSPRP